MALQHELDMSFNYEAITYGEIKDGVGASPTKGSQLQMCLNIANKSDKCIGDVLERMGKKRTCFTDMIAWDSGILPTIKASLSIFDGENKRRISNQDIIHSQTFPEDYDFGTENIGYICGMSVPPVMIKRIVTRLIESGVFDG